MATEADDWDAKPGVLTTGIGDRDPDPGLLTTEVDGRDSDPEVILTQDIDARDPEMVGSGLVLIKGIIILKLMGVEGLVESKLGSGVVRGHGIVMSVPEDVKTVKLGQKLSVIEGCVLGKNGHGSVTTIPDEVTTVTPGTGKVGDITMLVGSEKLRLGTGSVIVEDWKDADESDTMEEIGKPVGLEVIETVALFDVLGTDALSLS